MPKRNRELVSITKTGPYGQCLVEHEANYYIWYIPKNLRKMVIDYPDEFDMSFTIMDDNRTFINIVLVKTQECILKQEVELMD